MGRDARSAHGSISSSGRAGGRMPNREVPHTVSVTIHALGGNEDLSRY